MKWSKSSKDLTKDEWERLNPIERYDATRHWVSQNRKDGQMPKRAAYTSMRRALQRAKVIIPPVTSFSKLQLLSFEYKPDFLIERFLPKRKKIWLVAGRRRPLKNKNYFTAIPVNDFSLLDNPIAVFTTLKNLCIMEAVSPPGNIDFIDDHIRDIGAYLLLSILYQRMIKFAEGGIMSSRVAKVLKAVGLTETMRIHVSSSDTDDVFPLPLNMQTRQNMVSSSIGEQTSRKEKVASEVIEKVEGWLKSVGVVLPKSTLAPLAKAIGEVLDNAERHSVSTEASHDSGGWWIAGFMARRQADNGEYRHVCHISIVGLGLTISDTLLQSPKANDRFHPQLIDYSMKGGRDLNEKQCATVLSLQDAVTSKMDASGGLGMQDLIANIAELGGGKGIDKMCVAIVSGSSCVRVISSHISRGQEEIGHRQCWLNDSNSADDAPGPESVIDIGMDFPGTCISMRFELDQEHLKGAVTSAMDTYLGGYPISNAIYRDL